MRFAVALLALALPSLHASAQEAPTPVPLGITSLLDTCQPAVGYRHFNGEPTALARIMHRAAA